DDPAISYGIVFGNFMSKGVYTFSGGTDRLVKAMKSELERHGVDLFNKVQVDRIRVSGSRVEGIEAHGRFIAADAVVSNASLKSARWSDWASLDEPGYAAAKERLIEQTLASLELHVPGVRSKIDHVEASTPRTFQFYTQAPQGTSFGTKFEGLKKSLELSEQ